MTVLRYYVEGDEDRSEAIRAVKTLAAAYNLEAAFPPPTLLPGDIPG